MHLIGHMWRVAVVLDNVVLEGVPEALIGEYCNSQYSALSLYHTPGIFFA